MHLMYDFFSDNLLNNGISLSTYNTCDSFLYTVKTTETSSGKYLMFHWLCIIQTQSRCHWHWTIYKQYLIKHVRVFPLCVFSGTVFNTYTDTRKLSHFMMQG